MKIINEIKTKEEFLELYEKCWLENYEPTIEFRDEIINLTMLGYINLGYNTMVEISKQMDEIRERFLNIKQNNRLRILNKIIEDECL